MAVQINQLANTAITAHAFNSDRTQLSVCENSNEVKIYTKSASTWSLTESLTDHDKVVTSIDWAPNRNQIVTASQDRNAYVWNYGIDPLDSSSTAQPKWLPTLVLLRLNRSATVVRWSPDEQKFAVGSGSRTIAVCQYDDESNWWVAKHIKKPLRSTVLALDWHPNSVLLASGSADGRCRVFSAFIKGVDSKPAPSKWGERLPFNTVCGDFGSPAGGWVHDVAFSPSGDALAFVSHDATVTVVYPSGADQPPSAVWVIKLSSLPLLSLCFCTEDVFVGSGHDCQPILFSGDERNGWAEVKSLDEQKGSSTSAQATRGGNPSGGIGRLNNEAFNLFRSADSRGVTTPSGGESVPTGHRPGVDTIHSNTITSIRPFSGSTGSVNQVSTSGVDGKVVIWNLQSGGLGGVTKGMGNMRMG
ncbi:WD40-repeat-containing domain protein [Melampsora americana]|nr:WD40-repeat-containing domain protein [Melampsora americana]